MDNFPSTENLNDYLNHKIYHSSPEIRSILPWEACLLIIKYANEMYHDGHCGPCRDDINTLVETIRVLEAKASEFAAAKELYPDELVERELNIYDTFVQFLIPEGQIYFTLPTTDIFSLAMFFAFLYTILENSEPTHHYLKRNQLLFRNIIKELKFLFNISVDFKSHIIGNSLGDRDRDLLSEFQSVANEAGSFTYSCVFACMCVKLTERVRVLKRKFRLLNVMIKIHCTHFTKTPDDISDSPFSSTDTLNSLIELESLQALLEDLMNRLESINDDMKDHTKKLHAELRSLRSLLKAKITNFPHQPGENNGLKKYVIPIRNVTAEAQFLIKTFLDGHFPVWYMALRLYHVITKFEVIRKASTDFVTQHVHYNPIPEEPSKDEGEKIQTSTTHASITHLSKYLTSRDFGGIEEWTGSIADQTITWEGQRLPWNSLSYLAVVCYALKLCPDDDSLMNAIKDLNNLASGYELDHVQKEKAISEVFVNVFMPMAQKLFTLPKSSNPNPIIEDLAGFIHFLLQILNSEADHIGNEKRYISLQKGLKFLLALLGDIPFRHTELGEVSNLLREFQILVNEAGIFIFSSNFTTIPVNFTWFCVCMDVLIYRFHLLNAKIIEHCIRFADLRAASIYPKNCTPAGEDSFFIIESLLTDLENLLKHNIYLMNDYVKYQIEKLHAKVHLVRSFLTFHNGKVEIKGGVMQIRDAAYEAEYLINSFVSGNFPYWYVSFRLPNVTSKFDIFVEGYGEINKVHDLQDRQSLGSNDKELKQGGMETSTADSIFVGYKNESEHILEELRYGSKELQIIPVFGMPGVGKTTLAKKVYNDGTVTRHFDRRSWCVVSQTYQKRKVLTDILASLTSWGEKGTSLTREDDDLGVAIHQNLFGRRYLIVIDDVWNTDVFDDLKHYFPNNENGSRILFTSRGQNVTPGSKIHCHNIIIHTLPLMPEDQCWELFEKKVFSGERCPKQLVMIGKEIASKCSGLPLVVVIVAGVLANMEKNERVWGKVVKCLDSYKSNWMKILELSYKHLPGRLKLCFLFLGVFPEDTEIPAQKLIRLWIAEGFIPKEKGKSQEDVANEYLNCLIDRSLVSISKNRSSGGVKACVVHDLLREMCLTKAQEEDFLTLITGDHHSAYEKHQRLCANSTGVAYMRPFSLYCRSFFGHLSDPSSCFPQMTQVRTMELSRNIEEVGSFYKLRNLDLLVCLRYLIVDRLPEGNLSNLVNLESLCIYSLSEEVCLPSTVLKLVKLRHLHARDLVTFENDSDISHDNHLETLSFLKIYQTRAHEILKCSKNLRKLKCMCLLRIPDFRFLTDLESLRIEVKSIYQITENSTSISLPQAIKKLTLSGSCLPWGIMSVLGRLQHLQVLKLLRDAFVGEEWETMDNEFPMLKFLKFQCLQLKKWIASSEHFPILEHLVLNRCEKLQKIPSEIGEIPTMKMIEVHGCSKEASTSAIEMEQVQHEFGNEELEVIITNDRWS